MHAGAEPIENLVAPAFKEMTAKFGRYLANGGVEPTWATVVELTTRETMLNFSLKSSLPKLAAATLQPQMTTEQQAAAAAVNKEARAAAAAAKEAGQSVKGKWIPRKEFAKLSPDDKQAKAEARTAGKQSPGN